MGKIINDLKVLKFVHSVSSPVSNQKRIHSVKNMLKTGPKKLTNEQWMQLWRGFYYAIWYTEMNKGGHELIEEIGNTDNVSLLIIGFKSLSEAWNGIDSVRLDKYLYLIRFMLRNLLNKQIQAIVKNEESFDNCECLKMHQEMEKNENFTKIKAHAVDYMLTVTLSSPGLIMHITDIYYDELKELIDKNESLNKDEQKMIIYSEMLIPFIKCLSKCTDERVANFIEKNIFMNFINFISKQSIPIRIDILDKISTNLNLCYSFKELKSVQKNLLKMCELFKDKLEQLNGKNNLKRKNIEPEKKKNKKVYVRSIVPLPEN